MNTGRRLTAPVQVCGADSITKGAQALVFSRGFSISS